MKNKIDVKLTGIGGELARASERYNMERRALKAREEMDEMFRECCHSGGPRGIC